MSQVVTLQKETVACENMQPCSVEAGGIETVSKEACFQVSSRNGLRSDAKTDATSLDLQKLIDLWPRLDDDVKARLLAMTERALKTKKAPVGH